MGFKWGEELKKAKEIIENQQYEIYRLKKLVLHMEGVIEELEEKVEWQKDWF